MKNNRWNRVVKKWNSDQKKITNFIQISNDKYAAFKWNQLVVQEIRMWIRLDEQVTQDDFDWICERRGFDKNMISYLKDLIKVAGIGEKL